MYIQQDATLHSLFYLETALHVLSGTITHHQERKQLYLQHLAFVTPLLLTAAIVKELELVCVCYSTLKPVPPLPSRILPPLVSPMPVIQYIFLHCLYLSAALYLKKPLFLHKNNTVKFISNTEFCLFVCKTIIVLLFISQFPKCL
jgi:hypothetical protein